MVKPCCTTQKMQLSTTGSFILQPNNSNEATERTRCSPASGGEAGKKKRMETARALQLGQFGFNQKVTGTQWKNVANIHRITQEIEIVWVFLKLGNPTIGFFMIRNS